MCDERQLPRVQLKMWGIALLVPGVVVIGAGLFGVFGARAMWQDADAACAGSGDDWCGGAKTYATALLLVLAPLATLGGALMILAGGVLIAIGRWLDDKLEQAGTLATTLLR